MEHQELGVEFLKALNRYFTPVAVGILLCALLFNPEMPAGVFGATIGLIVGSILFNSVSAVYIIDHPASWRQLGYARVAVNFLFNAAAYLLLQGYWPMIWVLFALGPVAMAFYGDVAETFWVLGAIGLVMLGHLWYRQAHDPKLWGEVVLQIFFILILSLFLIKVAQLIRREREQKA